MTAQRVHSLIVDVDGSDLAYQYMCRIGETVPPLATFRQPVDLSLVRALSEGVSRALLPGSHSTDAIRDWGGRLYDALLPADLADKLQSDAASYLVLYLDPSLIWIPWEMLWDGAQFMCRRFHVARLLQKTANELRAAERRLQHERSGRGALILFGDITGLSAASEKSDVEEALRGVYRSNIWFRRSRDSGDLLALLKQDYDICHFIGHGRYVPDAPEESGWVLSDGAVLTCRDIERVSSQATFPLLILANACDSAHASLLDHEQYVSTLYRAFLCQGVPHYVGTCTPVPDALGKEFAASFWRLFGEGASVGEAIGKTRETLAQRTPLPIWASYVHYGDPTYRLVRPETDGSPPMDGTEDERRVATEFSTLGRARPKEIYRTMEYYKAAVREDPGDEDAHFALGLCYLQLGIHDLAIKSFDRTIEIMPGHADGHYYLALSLIRGRRPKTLSLGEVRRMEQHLETARLLDPRQAKYDYLAAILKYDYFLENGLRVNGTAPATLLAMAEEKEHDPWEVERLLGGLILRDRELLARIRGSNDTRPVT